MVQLPVIRLLLLSKWLMRLYLLVPCVCVCADYCVVDWLQIYACESSERSSERSSDRSSDRANDRVCYDLALKIRMKTRSPEYGEFVTQTTSFQKGRGMGGAHCQRQRAILLILTVAFQSARIMEFSLAPACRRLCSTMSAVHRQHQTKPTNPILLAWMMPGTYIPLSI